MEKLIGANVPIKISRHVVDFDVDDVVVDVDVDDDVARYFYGDVFFSKLSLAS